MRQRRLPCASDVSERERHRISAFYYGFGTGDLDKANQTYEMWKQSYPSDTSPRINLETTT
jgi:hypothetical protein